MNVIAWLVVGGLIGWVARVASAVGVVKSVQNSMQLK